MIEHADRQHGELMAEMRAAREEDRNQSQAICSLFRETMAAMDLRSPCLKLLYKTLPRDSADLIDTTELETGGGAEIHALLDMEEPHREQGPLPTFPIPQSPVTGPPVQKTDPKHIIKKRKNATVMHVQTEEELKHQPGPALIHLKSKRGCVIC
ncbi:UNVERIFIED_CONTAM: hypothetical protein K2H54_048773 [Gekko kuhli]